MWQLIRSNHAPLDFKVHAVEGLSMNSMLSFSATAHRATNFFRGRERTNVEADIDANLTGQVKVPVGRTNKKTATRDISKCLWDELTVFQRWIWAIIGVLQWGSCSSRCNTQLRKVHRTICL